MLWATIFLLGGALGDHPPQLVETSPLLHGNDPSGNQGVAGSPDPLVATTWSSGTNITGLQVSGPYPPVP